MEKGRVSRTTMCRRIDLGCLGASREWDSLVSIFTKVFSASNFLLWHVYCVLVAREPILDEWMNEWTKRSLDAGWEHGLITSQVRFNLGSYITVTHKNAGEKGEGNRDKDEINFTSEESRRLDKGRSWALTAHTIWWTHLTVCITIQRPRINPRNMITNSWRRACIFTVAFLRWWGWRFHKFFTDKLLKLLFQKFDTESSL